MIKSLILVGAGGMAGSIARYLIALALTRPSAGARGFLYATFTVNVIGSLAIGVIFGLSERSGWLTSEWRLLLATGFCGGFTTFSAFSLESVFLLQQKDYVTFAVYALLSLTLCLAGTFLGLFVSRP